jgi:hypothetical protein
VKRQLALVCFLLRLASQATFALEEAFVGHPAIEALGGEDTQFGLSQVEPAAMLRRVVPFEPLDQTTRFIGWKSFIK